MKQLLTLILIFSTTLNIIAQNKSRLTAFRDTLKDTYNFWLYEPDTTLSLKQTEEQIEIPKNLTSLQIDSLKISKQQTALYPIVVFLHGQSLCGHNLYRVRQYGVIDAIERGRKIDAIVLAPQNPGGAWNPSRVLKMINFAAENYNVDTNRIYVLGMSLGGYGTMDFVGTYPEKVAAGIALCGGTTLKNKSKIGEAPLMIAHGTADRAVSVKCSDEVADYLREIGKDSLMIYTRIPKASHSKLARCFYLPQTYDWLFSHNLQDNPRTINRDFEYSNENIADAYLGISRPSSNFVEVDTSKSIDDKAMSTVDTWVIRKGDTLSGIAKKTHSSVKTICRLNNITPTTTLRIGRKLVVR